MILLFNAFPYIGSFSRSTCAQPCLISLNGANITAVIKTGHLEDSFSGCNVNANLRIFSNDGDDTFTIGPFNPAKKVSDNDFIFYFVFSLFLTISL